MTRIEKLLNSKGRQIIGWDEILEGARRPQRNCYVMAWLGRRNQGGPTGTRRDNDTQ